MTLPLTGEPYDTDDEDVDDQDADDDDTVVAVDDGE